MEHKGIYGALRIHYILGTEGFTASFHSDLGSQYTSNDLKDLCKKFSIEQSFGKKRNRFLDSFFSPC